MVEVYSPKERREALSLLAEHAGATKIIAGGTALMPMIKQRFYQPESLVSLHLLKPERAISLTEGALEIDGLITLRELERAPLMAEHAACVVEALHRVSNIRVRNAATLGGNLAHADPHLDLPPILMAMNAQVVAESARGQRTLALNDFFVGYYETRLEPDEMIRSVRIPLPQKPRTGSYKKFTALSEDDWPAVGVAAFATVSDGVVEELALAVSACVERPQRIEALEEQARGQKAGRDLAEELSQKVRSLVEPQDDLRGSAEYKRHIVAALTRRAVVEATSERGAR